MILQPGRLAGLWTIRLRSVSDERGHFTRTFCRREFSAHGLVTEFVQASESHTNRLGILRGLHFQRPPHAEVKLVRCTRGAVYDVIADLRPESPTFLQWQAFTLTEHEPVTLYVPAGCAHGFVTLTAMATVTYQMDKYYEPAAASGVCWNDPALRIAWPIKDPILNERDKSWTPLQA